MLFETIVGLAGSSLTSFIWAVMPEAYIRHVPFMPYLKEHLENGLDDVPGAGRNDLDAGEDDDDDDDEDDNNIVENDNDTNPDDNDGNNNNDNDNENNMNNNNNGDEKSALNRILRPLVYSYLFDCLILGGFVLVPYVQGKVFLDILSFLTRGRITSGSELVRGNNLLSVRLYILLWGILTTFLETFLLWTSSKAPTRSEQEEEGRNDIAGIGPDAILTVFLGVFNIMNGLFKLTILMASILFIIPFISGLLSKVLRSPVHFEYNIYKDEHSKAFEIFY